MRSIFLVFALALAAVPASAAAGPLPLPLPPLPAPPLPVPPLPVPLPGGGGPAPTPYEGTAAGRFFHIVPPGEAGSASGIQTAQFLANGTRPPHFSDQRDLYTDLLYATPGLKDADIGKYFPEAGFGVKPEDVERTYAPRGDVTIVRDKSFGVPHVYGATRAGTSFGLGYAVAEDRLFFMDALRHYGRADLASFAGGANLKTDREQWEIAPYTDADRQRQIDELPALYGQDGQNLVDDVKAWCEGVNAYITALKLNPTAMPAEYVLLGKTAGPEPWKPTDVLDVASLIGAQLGKGGGNELEQVQLLQSDLKRFGAKRGLQVWEDFRSEDDPEAPTTSANKKQTPYGQLPAGSKVLKTVAMPDEGTLRLAPTQDGQAAPRSAVQPASAKGLLRFPTTDSNALLVSAKHTATGHPMAVFGSQASYYEPEIWWRAEAHGPGFDVNGTTIPGTGPYIEIGRGHDYAWSATSASQDIIDVYALDLCNVDGSKATIDSNGYVYRGTCNAMEDVVRQESWTQSPADATPSGSATLRIQRTKMGLVAARSTIKGVPVAYTKLRSTYGHELDSAPGFQEWNDPEKVHDVQSFQRSAMKVGYTFNWLYADDKDIGYINTGANPERRKNVNGLLPIRYAPQREWKGWDPATLTTTQQPMAERPQAINQPYLVSWNNKQAVHCCGGSAYTPLWRSQLLSDRLDTRIAKGRKIALGEVVDAAEDAATVDLRGDKMLPIVLKVLGTPKDPKLAAAATELKAWVASGSHRIDKDRDGHYEQGHAVQLMDAWYTTLPKAVFARMGQRVFDGYDAELLPDVPNSFHADLHRHLGSSWEDGWFGYVQKDLRALVDKKKPRGAYRVRFCGNGKLAACRAAITASLAEALAIDPAKQFEDPSLTPAACGKMDTQACYDALRFTPIGAITQPFIPWQNRPTQQQVVEVTAHRPR